MTREKLQMIFNEAQQTDDRLTRAMASIAMGATQVGDYAGSLLQEISEEIRVHGSALNWCSIKYVLNHKSYN